MIVLRLLGEVSVEAEGLSPNARVKQRYPLTLLALVASVAPRTHSRDEVAAYLWPDSDESRARNSLRQALYHIRQDLGDDVFLPDASHDLQLDPEKVDCDLWRFRESLENNELEAAAETYEGAFLEGFRLPGGVALEHWADGTRRELRLSYIEILDGLGRRAMKEERWDDAVRWRRRLAAVTPLSSRAALSLLESLTAAGDRAGALQYASIYEKLVSERLQVEPDAEVTEFVARLKASPEMGRRTPRSDDTRPTGAEVASASTESTSEASVEAPKAEESPPEPPVEAAPARPPWGVAGVAAALLLAVGAVVGWAVSEAGGNGLEGVGSEAPAAGLSGSPPGEGVILLTSGSRVVDGRDEAVRLVECRGPACPEGSLPQPAFVVPRHVYYMIPGPGTGFIAPVRDGVSRADPGYPCCTEAVFEVDFGLPPTAASGRIMIGVYADNGAVLEVNGQEFARFPEGSEHQNPGPLRVFGTGFTPSQEGPNVLRITLVDQGGALALHFRALVTPVGEG